MEQLAELRRDMTAALILATEETEKGYRAALARTEGCGAIAEARTSLAQRAEYLQAARTFLWADFLWPRPPAAAEDEPAFSAMSAPTAGLDVTGRSR